MLVGVDKPRGELVDPYSGSNAYLPQPQGTMMMVGKCWEPAEELIRRPSPAGFQNVSVTGRYKMHKTIITHSHSPCANLVQLTEH